MKKRILSILLLCCMVLTLLPVTAFATGELRDSTNVTVTFDSDGGSAVEPQSVPQGQLVQRPADPIKDGHTFIGWYNKADLQYINLPEWNFDYPVFENMELVAQWMEAMPISTDPVAYLDENGQTKYCTAYTVLTSETKESILDYDDKWYDLPAGWYVVEGDVTITPRLDTHGAVNLILTNGSHLTAEWGIDVKVGDTFTVYAQSTDEGTMGRLTACLPADFNLDRMVHYSVWPYSGMAGIGSSARWRAGNDGIRESEGTIIINGGNIRAKGQNSASAIGGPRDSEIEFRYTDRGEVYNRRQGGSITINGGIVRTEPFALPEGNPLAVTSVGIGTCHYGYGGSVTINGGTVIAEAANDAITTGDGGTITINGGDVTARGGVNNFGENSHRVLSGNGIGPLENGSITINGGTVKATAEGKGFGIGGSRFEIIGTATVTINGGTIEATANHNNAAIGDKGKGESGVTINGGVIHAIGKGGAAGIGSKGDIRITGGEITVSAEGSGAAIGGFTDSYSGRVDCESITINGDVIKSISSKDGACIGAAAGGSVGSITISDAELPLLSSNKILIGWDADSPGGKLTIRNCRVASTDTLSVLTDGIRVGSNSELVIEESEIRLPHLRGIRVGGNGSIAVRDSDLHTYGIFMDETAQSSNDAKTLKKLEITNSTVLTGDIIGARGGYSSVDEVVIHGSSIRLNDEYTYNYCTIGGGTHGSFGSIDIQNSQIHIPSSGGNTAIGNGWQVYYNRESRIRIANSEVSVRCASLGPAIGAAWDSGSGRINIIIENSTVTAKGGNLRTDGNYVPGIGKNALGRAPEIGIQILNSTVDTFRLTEKGGTDYVYDDLHEKNLPGIPPENITICGSTVNGTRIDHSPDEYGKCALCGKYDIGYCYEHGLLTMEGLTDCVSDGSEKKMTGLSHKTGENETKQLTENTDYTAIYSNNVHPYTLKPDDAGFEPAKAPKVTLYGMGNYCGKAEHYFTISENAAAAPSITTSSLPDGKVGETYSQTLTANGTAPITWSIDGGLPAGLSLNADTGEISGTPTADGTAKFTVKATNSAGSDTKELSITIAKAAPAEYTVTVTSGGNGTASASPAKAVAGAEITLTAMPNEGYRFKEWEVISGGVTIVDDKFTMPNNNVEVKAIFEEDTPPAPTEHTVTVTSGGNGTASASPSKAVAGAEITLSATPDKGYHLKEWQVESPTGLVITNNKFTMPDSNVEVKAIFEEDAPPAPTEHTVTVTSSGNGTASASPVKAVAGAEITLSATPDKGYHLKEWQVISGGVSIKDNKFTMPNNNVEIKAIFEKDVPPTPTEHTVTVTSGGNGTASASPSKAVAGAEITLSATPDKGYHLKEWQVESPTGLVITNNKFTMPDSNVEVKAIFEEDAPPAPTDPAKPNISVTGAYTYNGSVHTATVSGYDPATMDISGNTATDAGDYTVRVTSKTGKWADGSTDAVTAAWSIGKATQEAPIGLNGVAPTTEGGSDGKITGVDATMEYRAESEITYTACTGIEIENLSAGNYFVRYAEDHNHFASPDAEVTVGEGASLADCTITFNAGGGSGSMDSVTVKTGANYILPACGFTAPTDQEFKAWEIGGTEYKVGDSYTVNGDIEIKALWKNRVITPTTYTVTVSNDGNGTGTAAPSTAAAGTTITLTAMPNEGYHFKEWEVISGGVTIKDDKFLMPNGNVEVKAIFEEDAPPVPTEFTITVKTDGNGTASASHAKAVVGTEITLIATPKTGYHFKEWQVMSGGVTIKDDKFTMPSANVEVKAIFEKDAPPAPTEFTITVTSGGNGTASASPAKAAAGTEITLTATPDKGYHFKEWQVISGGVTIKDDKFTMPSANVEVKAIFEKDAPPAPTEFTVIFDGNGGTPSVDSMTTTNRKLTSLPSASRSGSYSFDGWYTEKSGGTKITTDTVLHANITVYAHWTYIGGGGGSYNPPVTYYTLRFETGGGSDIPSVREAYNAYIDLTKYVPTWRGHTFIGWYSERSLMNKVSGVYLTKDMTVYALWRVDENPGTGANPFTDVSEKDWFYGDVMFVYENGLMLGTSKTLFSPHGTATRGMMATILWRMEGSPAPKGKNSFTDVEAGKWYADAITWTAENGIFAGYGKDKFGPDDPITREQLAAIFYRYADYKGYDLTVKGNLDKFKDADKITDYAKTAMQWAVGNGLVKGKSGNLLDPQGTATRAEIAAMLHRFIEKYELVQGKAPGGLMGWIDPKRLQIPKTGDSSVLGLWGISLCTSLAGCLVLTTWQIRRRREEEALQIIEK